MRRFVAFTIASCFVLAIGPAAALARHHHHRHHHHARMERFGTLSSSSTSTTSPTTAPSSAGTITSFSNGVLTITLNDNSTVSGTVTPDTEIDCTSSSTTMGDDLARDDGPDGGTQGGDQGDQSDQSDQGDQGEDQGDQGEDQGDDNQGSCTTSALTTGATVLGAELEITSAGSVWKQIDLG